MQPNKAKLLEMFAEAMHLETRPTFALISNGDEVALAITGSIMKVVLMLVDGMEKETEVKDVIEQANRIYKLRKRLDGMDFSKLLDCKNCPAKDECKVLDRIGGPCEDIDELIKSYFTKIKDDESKGN